jgi:hydrogenase expression/formation protein HypE
MQEKYKNILLGHGSGGVMSHKLIEEVFMKQFSNDVLNSMSDSAVLDIEGHSLAFTTDSFVVDPISFPGGDIGKLAIAGTVNDLSVSGAQPLFLSSAFIIEEGLPMDVLKAITTSMHKEAQKAGISIVTGDTKVVQKGKCDKVFINTAGIGLLPERLKPISNATGVAPGDKIIINGSIGDHGMAVLAAREFMNLSSEIQSDCACLNHMIQKLIKAGINIKFMRDATRGGLATVMVELTEDRDFGLELFEENINVKENVRGMCELLGYDPLYVANEGKVVMIVDNNDADEALRLLQSCDEGREASLIGQICREHPGQSRLNTAIGGKRVLDMLAGEQLPRIC